uniref:Uncharacterized protein n=1 Tax=Denticeps clupeoides TaxID=299321 RepID=A0AAY4CSX5_9TELE
MKDVAEVDQGRRGDGNDLQHPEADVRDGEGVVVADVLAAWLLGVADEVRLLVSPNPLSSSAQDQDAEHEEHRQPDLPDHGGVGLHLVQEAAEEVPLSHLHFSHSVWMTKTQQSTKHTTI